jgi:hypothetical protein
MTLYLVPIPPPGYHLGDAEPGLHKKSGSDARGASSILNKPPLLVVVGESPYLV